LNPGWSIETGEQNQQHQTGNEKKTRPSFDAYGATVVLPI